MDKFWKWMKKKGYIKCEHCDDTCVMYVIGGKFIPFLNESIKYDLSKQMLIGYFIEFLYCIKKDEQIAYGIIDIPIDIYKGKGSINRIYNYLKKEIKRLK